MPISPTKGATMGASCVVPGAKPPKVLYGDVANALFARMSQQPDADLALALNTALSSLALIIPKMDGFWVWGLQTQQASNLNWAANDSVTPGGSPVHVPYRGWNGVTGSDYLATGKSVDGVKFTQNSMSIGAFIRDDYSPASIYAFGTADGLLRMTPKAGTAPGNINGKLNSATNHGNIVNSNAAGLHAFNRSAAAVTQTYVRGANVGNGVTVSSDGTGNVEFLRDPNTLNPFTQSLFAGFMGQSLTAGEHQAISDALTNLKAYTDTRS